MAPTKDQREKELLSARDKLNEALTGFKIHLAYGIPDWILFQLGIEVLEQTGAVLLLAKGPSPRASVANARSAFEAAIDMMVLVAEPTVYDEMGAFARASELLAWEEMRARRAAADKALGLKPIPPDKSPEQIVEEESKRWEAESPGVSAMYKRVLVQARDQRRWKHHWSGLGSRKEMAEYISRRARTYPGFEELVDVFWGLQSMHSHPGPRTGLRKVSTNDKGQLLVAPKPGDEGLPLAMASAACQHALDAIKRREKFVK